MKTTYTLLAPALVALASAQTAPGFPVQVDRLLTVDYQNTSTSVEPAGVTLDREKVLDVPVATGQADATRQTTYVLFMIDMDVLPQGQTERVPLLHWFQPNMFGASDVLSFDASAVNSTTAVGAGYIPPTPPEGDGPHRYNIIAYVQPRGFEVPSQFSAISPPTDNSARIGFSMEEFAAATNLGEPWAATWFQVENNGQTANPTESGSASGTGSGNGGSSASATGSGAQASATGESGNAAGVVVARDSVRNMLVALGAAAAALWMM